MNTDKLIKEYFDRQEAINKEMARHAEIANQEMSHVKENISGIKVDLGWIRQNIDKIDNKVWFILTSVILGILAEILIKVWK